MSNVLLAGEQFTSAGFEIKGFDYFGANAYCEDAQPLVDALTAGGHEVDWLRTHRVPAAFPESTDALGAYDVVLLSDVGSNSLLFHPTVLKESQRRPNRLTVLREYVAAGGGLAMIGGWMSFSGIDGRARYHGTAVEEALPVTCRPYDDRQERPEGVVPRVVAGEHPALAGVPDDWPFFLGYNRVTPKETAEVLVAVDDDPLLCVWTFGRGRAAAFTSDCAPHWAPPDVLTWPGYAHLWSALTTWLGG